MLRVRASILFYGGPLSERAPSIARRKLVPLSGTSGNLRFDSLLLHELLHTSPVHFAHVDSVSGVNGYGCRISKPLDLLHHLAVLCAGYEETVILLSIDDVNQLALDEQAPRRAEVGPLI